MKLKNVEDIYPLAPIQRVMLLYSLSHPRSVVLNEQTSFTLQGDIQLQAFKRAWSGVIQRHALLRTAFVWDGLKQPMQVVRRDVSLPWQEQDWREYASEEQERRLKALLCAEREAGFDLTQAPLMRFLLLRLTDTSDQFIWTYHHAIIDGWSIGVIFHEVFILYEGFIQGRTIDLPMPARYRIYIQWIQTQQERAETFWRPILQGWTPKLAFSTEKGARSDGEVGEDAFCELVHPLSKEITAQLQHWSRQLQISLSTWFYAAWGVLLSRFGQVDDLIFGITVAGRPASIAGIEQIVGPFINNLPLRIQIADDELLQVLLGRLHRQQAEMQEHAYVSPMQLQQWSEVPSYQRLYESLVIVENYPDYTAATPSVAELDVVDVQASVRTNYPLTLVVIPGQAVQLSVSYDHARFHAGTIQSLLEQLGSLLHWMSVTPEQAVSWYRSALSLATAGLQLFSPVGAAGEPSHLLELASPRDPFELQLAQIWEELFARQPIGIETNFFELGGSSLMIVALVERIQQQMHRQVNLVQLVQHPTIAAMARLLRRGEAIPGWSPLVPLQLGAPQKTPFFCVHPGPGSVFCYLPLARHLDADQPLYGLQARGLQEGDEPLTSVEAMAALYIGAIRTVQAEGPYLLGGHCFGGIVALEMAQQLIELGQEVAFLAIIDTPPPLYFQQAEAVLPEEVSIVGMAGVLERFFGIALDLTFESLQDLHQDQQVAYFVERLRFCNILPPEAGLQYIRALLRVSQANDQANISYTPRMAPLPITLLRAQELPETFGEGMLATLLRDRAMGWGPFSPQPVEVHSVSGDHITMLTDPHVAVLAQQIQAGLRRING